MAEIAIESRTVNIPGNLQTFNFQHLYLVYTNDAGTEFTIGGHLEDSQLVITSDVNLKDVPKEGRDYRENTDQARAERLHTPLDLNGRDAADVWKEMVQQAKAISDAKIPYTTDFTLSESDNSNSTVASVLNAVGIDLQQVLSSLKITNFRVPGSEDIFSEYADRLNTILFGEESPDILYGGYGDDLVSSLDGNDILSGFTPLYSSSDKTDTNANEIDLLTGGSGKDLFILGTGDEIFYRNSYVQSQVSPEIFPRTDDLAGTYFLPEEVRPNSFALITDFNAEQGDQLQLKGPGSFNTEEGDFNNYRIIDVLNSNYMYVDVNNDPLKSEISKLNLNPNAYSSALVYSEGFNKNDGDFREDNIVAIFPGNFEKTLYGSFNINLTPGSGDVVFV